MIKLVKIGAISTGMLIISSLLLVPLSYGHELMPTGYLTYKIYTSDQADNELQKLHDYNKPATPMSSANRSARQDRMYSEQRLSMSDVPTDGVGRQTTCCPLAAATARAVPTKELPYEYTTASPQRQARVLLRDKTGLIGQFLPASH